MARRKLKQSQFLERSVIAALLLAVGAAVYFNHLADRVQATAGKLGDFDLLRGGRLVDHGTNDGDSFHVAHAGKEFVFRLYYVDCPEKSARNYKQRVADQAGYFGGISEAEAVEVGLEAKDYVEDLLKRNEFEIYTRWEEVYNSGRYYAFVRIGGVGEGRLLSELLVERGLARIYTKGVNLPGGERFKDQREDLWELERRAKAARVGGWR